MSKVPHNVFDSKEVLFGTELAMPDGMFKELRAVVEGGKQPDRAMLDRIAAINVKRNAALASMDMEVIKEYARESGVNFANAPETEEGFRISVLIAVTSITSLPMKVRRDSKRELQSLGWPSFDDGTINV